MGSLTRQNKPRRDRNRSDRLIMIQISLLFFFTISFITVSTALASLETEQPSAGPGSGNYRHSKVIKNSYDLGAHQYYIFEPDDPKPVIAPLIIFMHGFEATSPNSYYAWIEHIVKRGNIVVYPVYQSIASGIGQFTSNSIEAVSDAVNELQNGNHVEPDLDKFATVGHSMGGILASNIAALAKESGLPKVRAVMSVEPGKDPNPRIEDLSKIPGDTLLLTLVGDSDFIVGNKDAKTIFKQTTRIPIENKDYIIVPSDSHGLSRLTADHFAPCCMSFGSGSIPFMAVDPLDYYGFWKLFDALTDAAFYGENREYALGNTPQQRYMGVWSDGTPRKELIVTDNP